MHATKIRRNVQCALLTKLVHATRANFQLADENVCTATVAWTKFVSQMHQTQTQNQSIAITFTTNASSSTRANWVWCKRVWRKSPLQRKNSVAKITAVAFSAMKIIAIGRNHRNRRHAIQSMSCMRWQCLPLLFSALCCLNEFLFWVPKCTRWAKRKIYIFFFFLIWTNILTRWA